MQLLHSLKASKFAIQLLAPLGCLPISRQEIKTGNECYEPLNDLVKQHNEKIGPMLHDLAKIKLPVFSSPSLISTTLLFVGQIGILTTVSHLVIQIKPKWYNLMIWFKCDGTESNNIETKNVNLLHINNN